MPETFSAAFQIFALAMLPIAETRIAIPFGIVATDLPALSVLALAFSGSVAAILVVCPTLYRFGEAVARRSRLFTLMLQRARLRHASRFESAYDFALIALVAAPLPFSGVWTGILVAFVFGVPLRHAIALITLGTFLGSAFVLLMTLGIAQAF